MPQDTPRSSSTHHEESKKKELSTSARQNLVVNTLPNLVKNITSTYKATTAIDLFLCSVFIGNFSGSLVRGIIHSVNSLRNAKNSYWLYRNLTTKISNVLVGTRPNPRFGVKAYRSVTSSLIKVLLLPVFVLAAIDSIICSTLIIILRIAATIFWNTVILIGVATAALVVGINNALMSIGANVMLTFSLVKKVLASAEQSKESQSVLRKLGNFARNVCAVVAGLMVSIILSPLYLGLVLPIVPVSFLASILPMPVLWYAALSNNDRLLTQIVAACILKKDDVVLKDLCLPNLSVDFKMPVPAALLASLLLEAIPERFKQKFKESYEAGGLTKDLKLKFASEDELYLKKILLSVLNLRHEQHQAAHNAACAALANAYQDVERIRKQLRANYTSSNNDKAAVQSEKATLEKRLQEAEAHAKTCRNTIAVAEACERYSSLQILQQESDIKSQIECVVYLQVKHLKKLYKEAEDQVILLRENVNSSLEKELYGKTRIDIARALKEEKVGEALISLAHLTERKIKVDDLTKRIEEIESSLPKNKHDADKGILKELEETKVQLIDANKALEKAQSDYRKCDMQVSAASAEIADAEEALGELLNKTKEDTAILSEAMENCRTQKTALLKRCRDHYIAKIESCRYIINYTERAIQLSARHFDILELKKTLVSTQASLANFENNKKTLESFVLEDNNEPPHDIERDIDLELMRRSVAQQCLDLATEEVANLTTATNSGKSPSKKTLASLKRAELLSESLERMVTHNKLSLAASEANELVYKSSSDLKDISARDESKKSSEYDIACKKSAYACEKAAVATRERDAAKTLESIKSKNPVFSALSKAMEIIDSACSNSRTYPSAEAAAEIDSQAEDTLKTVPSLIRYIRNRFTTQSNELRTSKNLLDMQRVSIADATQKRDAAYSELEGSIHNAKMKKVPPVSVDLQAPNSPLPSEEEPRTAGPVEGAPAVATAKSETTTDSEAAKKEEPRTAGPVEGAPAVATAKSETTTDTEAAKKEEPVTAGPVEGAPAVATAKSETTTDSEAAKKAEPRTADPVEGAPAVATAKSETTTDSEAAKKEEPRTADPVEGAPAVATEKSETTTDSEAAKKEEPRTAGPVEDSTPSIPANDVVGSKSDTTARSTMTETDVKPVDLKKNSLVVAT